MVSNRECAVAGLQLAASIVMRPRWPAFIALGILLSLSMTPLLRTRRKLRAARSAPLPERLQVWEGEGGQNQLYASGRAR